MQPGSPERSDAQSVPGSPERGDRRLLGPSRPVPRVGARARIAHFGGGFDRGTVTAVHDDGRRLDVRVEGGEVLEFVLSPATARFVAAGGRHGPRLELFGDQA